MIKIFLIPFFICALHSCYAQNDSSFLYIQILDERSKEPLPFARIALRIDGHKKVNYWSSDFDGMIQIPNQNNQMRDSIFQYDYLECSNLGNKKRTFSLKNLEWKDTLTILLDRAWWELDEIVIEGTIEPLIERDWVETPSKTMLEILEGIVDRVDDVKIDSLRLEGEIECGRGMFKYLIENIHYPKSAIEKGNSGRVYVQLEFDDQGYSRNVEIIKGVSRELDAAVLSAILKMPKLNCEPIDDQESYLLPVEFRFVD
ncbi:MAG: TonB family protein [Crocinitomicaceae bacterium]|nr:TonB family protein [Crocinitomicaceae bacterium]